MSNDKRSVRSQWFWLLLYPDCEFHSKWFKTIMPRVIPSWFGVLHDRDLKDEVGEFDDAADPNTSDLHTDSPYKKAHWHVVVRVPRPMTLSAFQSIVASSGIDARFVRIANPWYAALYLDHRMFPDKAQYTADDILGDKALWYTQAGSGSSQMFDLFVEYLDALEYDHQSYTDCMIDLHKLGLFDMFKSNLVYHNMLMSVLTTPNKTKNKSAAMPKED